MKTYEEIMANKRVFDLNACSGFVKLTDCGTCTVVFGMNENGWEHVSVRPVKKYRIPSWNDMCQVKDIFWSDEEEVLQLHPKKSEYVNIADNCLHLWKPVGIDIMDTLDKAGKQE